MCILSISWVFFLKINLYFRIYIQWCMKLTSVPHNTKYFNNFSKLLSNQNFHKSDSVCLRDFKILSFKPSNEYSVRQKIYDIYKICCLSCLYLCMLINIHYRSVAPTSYSLLCTDSDRFNEFLPKHPIEACSNG